jgi:urocanate hydratase
LAVDPIESATGFPHQVERYYAGILRVVMQASNGEPTLGGKLLYAGELDDEARALIVAANIAGAATLAVSADVETDRQAMRDGVVDFLVTSLDEALRILKNEIRKRETVAVCVAMRPESAEAEMRERGVRPDLARSVLPAAPVQGQALLAWSVATAPAIWQPKLDALSLDCLAPEDQAARRWLRLAPRYLGRLAQGVRLLRCHDHCAKKFIEEARQMVECGEIGVAVEVKLSRGEKLEQYNFAP